MLRPERRVADLDLDLEAEPGPGADLIELGQQCGEKPVAGPEALHAACFAGMAGA